MRFFALSFFVLIFVEIWSIIAVGHRLGALPTFVLLMAGFVFGSQLIRYQAVQAMMRGMQQASQSESPLLPIMDALLKSFAGILFIIPGFVSDAFAFLLLIPFLRRGVARYLMTRGMFKAFASGGFKTGFGGFQKFGQGQGFDASVNEDFSQGNVYEHEVSTESSTEVKKQPKPAEVIDLTPESKDSPKK